MHDPASSARPGAARSRTKAVEALIIFLIVIVIYLSIAFEWRMAVAAFVALMHDIVITIGVYALTGFEVSPTTVIGLLTILGYSLYDTVVVFDKVRENTAGLLTTQRSTYSDAANLALNQTLVRSINTSLTALMPVASILFVGAGLLGAGTLKDLALVLFVGMLSGTYSSIFIATPVLADLKEREPQYKDLAVKVKRRLAGGRAAQRGRRRRRCPGRHRGGRRPARRPRPGDRGRAGRPDRTTTADRTPATAWRSAAAATRRATPRAPPGRPGQQAAAATGGAPSAARAPRRRGGSEQCRTSPTSITAHVRDIPDYPQPGVLFKDITPLLGDADAFGDVVEAMAATFGPVDKVVGIEARGFILAAPVAFEIRAGFVPVRKQGKLPSATFAPGVRPRVRQRHARGPPGRLPAGGAGADRGRRARHRRHRPRHRRPGPPGRGRGRRHRRPDGAVLPQGPRQRRRPGGPRAADGLKGQLQARQAV